MHDAVESVQVLVCWDSPSRWFNGSCHPGGDGCILGPRGVVPRYDQLAELDIFPLSNFAWTSVLNTLGILAHRTSDDEQGV